MYDLKYTNDDNSYELMELAKVFLPRENIRLIRDKKTDIKDNREAEKRRIFEDLAGLTAYRPPWGILTGVRPVKLTLELIKKEGLEKTAEILENEYLLADEKISLLLEIADFQRRVLRENHKEAALYIGIPFCPTRCLYCSFPAVKARGDIIEKYLEALFKEIHYVAKAMKERGLKGESLYIGGGTPTVLNEGQLESLLNLLTESFQGEELKEFSLEAGRPDTISKSKLRLMSDYGVSRISINPQTMKDESLILIGRDHSPKEIIRAFEEARNYNFSINMDLIAGLPGEDEEDFIRSADIISKMRPENITIHSLATKKGSRLMEEDRDYHYKKRKVSEKMLLAGKTILGERAYKPYYLYRQKNMAGALENIGYCLEGHHSIYNIRIMDEHQSIIALGAGAVSKVYYPKENRHERIANVSNPVIYIERIEEMIDRKKKDLFF